MAEKQSYAEQNKARLKEITDSIEAGIRELFQSDKYKQYLSTMSRFHRYSVNNVMLIHMQKPDATHVAGFNKWRDNFGRNVMKGEKGIKIIAPTPFKKKIEEAKLDPDTKLPMLDADGNAIMEEKTIQIPMYKVVSVFDVSQTEGKPLPELAETLTGNVQEYDAFMEALKRSSPVPIHIQPMRDDMDGYFSATEQRIAIREGMSQVQTVSAVVHEIAHSKLHNYDRMDGGDQERFQEVEIFGKPALFSNGRVAAADIPEGMFRYNLRGSDYDPGMPICIEQHVAVNHAGTILINQELDLGEDGRLMFTEDAGLNFTGGEKTINEYLGNAPAKKKDRHTEEIEAESISYAVCAYYGVETGANSFGYLASWSKDKELSALRESLETINKTSSGLISDIDRHYRDIMKERGLDKEKQPEQPEPDVEKLYMIDDDKYLHVQRTEAGVDYTIYDADSMHALDGGQLDLPDTCLSVAAMEICKMHEIGDKAPIRLAALEMIETLRAANEIPPVAEVIAGQPVSERGQDYPMPDESMTLEGMYAYGYTENDMLPLSKERAAELFEQDVPVYMLYDDNSANMAIDRDDIDGHIGMFGVNREEWDAAREYLELAAGHELTEQELENSFLHNPADAFAIYQLKHVEQTRDLRFAPMEHITAAGMVVDRDNYDLVYTGTLDGTGSTDEKLESLFEAFNSNRPEDFRGHSLSVSDIIALKQADAVSFHYCDSFGFAELPTFMKPENYLKNAEMAMEDDYGMIDGIINNGPKQPTVAALEQQAASGQPISLMDLTEAVHREQAQERTEKRPSVLAQLRSYQNTERTSTAPKKSAEREL